MGTKESKLKLIVGILSIALCGNIVMNYIFNL